MHSFHLLLVDDHENIRFTFRLALESDGYDVDAAATILEAQTKIEERCYDALILNLRLGAESGLKLSSQILEARHSLNCGDPGAGRLYLARALELNSHSADAHYLFGSRLELGNHLDKAKCYYKRALQLYAEHSFAQPVVLPLGDRGVLISHQANRTTVTVSPAQLANQ